MKICIMNFLDLKYPGGSPAAVKIVAESLKKRGHNVFVITTGPKGSKSFLEEIQYGIKVYRFYPFGTWIPQYRGGKISKIGRIFTFLLDFWNPHTYFIVKKILKKENPDVVYTNDLIYLSLAVFPAAKSLNIPVVSTFHCYQVFCPLKNHLLCINNKICKHPTLICKIYAKINESIIGDSLKIAAFVSNTSLKRHIEANVFSDKKKVVFPNIFDLKDIKPKKYEQISNSDNSFNILFVGRVCPEKGTDTLIKAFKKMTQSNLRLHICGDILPHNKNLFEKLSTNDTRIIFYGKVSEDKLDELRKISDICVYPSIVHESFGRIIVESFSYGLPVIGSNVGAIPELIQEGYNGFLFEPGNVEQLKEIFEYAILNRNKLKEMSENCINTAKKYSVENNIHKLEEIYKEIIKLNLGR